MFLLVVFLNEQCVNVSDISNLGAVCLVFLREEDGKLTTTVSSGE